MSKLGRKIIDGLHDSLGHGEGKSGSNKAHRVLVPERVDVKDIRHQRDMTQREFSDFFGFSLYSIRNWEQGKRRPEGPARVLLTIIAKEPEAVRRALIL